MKAPDPLSRYGLALALLLCPLGALACSAAEAAREMPTRPPDRPAVLFQEHCAACHGSYGAGNGPAAGYLRTRPRNFRLEDFRFTTSPDGTIASVEDIARFIQHGSPTSHMPANPWLAGDELHMVASYVRNIRRLGVRAEIEDVFLEEDEDVSAEELDEITDERMIPGGSLEVSLPPAIRPEDAGRGRDLFVEHCGSCHGSGGRGDGTEELFDSLDRPMRARDLTRGEYRGGASDKDLFTRIRCGLPGTPMPGLTPGIATDEEVWQIVRYLHVLAGRR
jgi:mono/diheme cytochrome c family protein